MEEGGDEMTAEEFLKRPYYLHQTLLKESYRIQQMESVLTSISATLSDMPRPETRNVHSMEDRIADVEDRKLELVKAQKEFEDIVFQTSDAIMMVEDEIRRDLLLKRYTVFMTWDQIAKVMGYAKQYVYQLHRRALKEFEESASSYLYLT